MASPVPESGQPSLNSRANFATMALTKRQVVNFKPLPGEAATLVLSNGAEYYGDVNAARLPHGHGVMINKVDSSRYGGQWCDGKQHGSGVLLTKDFEYEGEFDQDRMSGRGSILYKQTAFSVVRSGVSLINPLESAATSAKPLEYKGEFHREFHRHGHGVMTYRNDDVYDGEWCRNQRHGYGKFATSDGDRYEGEWSEDLRHGKGVSRNAAGVVFEGTLVRGKRVGHGKLSYPTGDVYEGEFKDGDMRGQGHMLYKNGDVYEGQWKNGVRNGQGKFYLARRQTHISGTFVDGLLDGPGQVEYAARGDLFAGLFSHGERRSGTLWLASGAVYCGEWRGESMHGKGIMWFADGGFYAGQWSSSLRQGHGHMLYSDGCEYSGSFVQDRRHGAGVMLLPDGRIATGTWQDGSRLHVGYVGEWDGAANLCGVGRFIYPDGSVYEGMVKAGMRDGFGICKIRVSDTVIQHAAASVGRSVVSECTATKQPAPYEERICPHHDDGPPTNGAVRRSSQTPSPVPEGHVSVTSAPANVAVLPPLFSCVSEAALDDPGFLEYRGMWSADAPAGEGTLAFPDGSTYAGQFVRGQRCGKGTLCTPLGQLYQGSWERDQPEGDSLFFDVQLDAPDRDEASPLPAEEPQPQTFNMLNPLSWFTWNTNTRRNSSAAERPQPSAAAPAAGSSIRGSYPPLCVIAGTWRLGRLSSKIVTAFVEGAVASENYLSSKPAVELPHKNSTLYTTTWPSSLCPLCRSTYGFLKHPVKCGLCARSACGVCLSEMTVPRNVPRDDEKRKTGHAHDPQITAAEKLPVGTGTITLDEVVLAAASSGIQYHEKLLACKDCFTAVQIGLTFATVWQPVADSTDLVVYRGFLAGTTLHGSGSLWEGMHSLYVGEFEAGKRAGMGSITFAHGEEYRGAWRNDNRHGRGTCRLRDGTFVSGLWRDDSMQTLEYHGQLNSALERHGLGHSYDPDTGENFNGEWMNGRKHGTGTEELPTGEVYKGKFAYGQRCGRGKLMRSTGSYVGGFSKGEMHGLGELREGSYAFTGVFCNGYLNGVGHIRSFATDDTIRTLFVRGAVFHHAILQGRRQKDAAAPACNGCNRSFTMLFRRHHCRSCGLVFCDSCSAVRIRLPEHFVDFNAAAVTLDGRFPVLDPREEYRVCKTCAVRIKQGSAIGSKYYCTPKGLRYHGELTADGLNVHNRGVFRLPNTSVALLSSHAEMAEEVVKQLCMSEHLRSPDHDTLHAVIKTLLPADSSPDLLVCSTAEQLSSLDEWWSDVVKAVAPRLYPGGGFFSHDDGDASEAHAVIPSLIDAEDNTTSRLPPELVVYDPAHFKLDDVPDEALVPLTQELGFEVAIFIDPSSAMGSVEGADKSMSQSFVPAPLPPPPPLPPIARVALSETLSRPVPLDKEELRHSINAARTVLSEQLGVPPPEVIRAVHVCPAPPAKPARGQPYNCAWTAWDPFIGPACSAQTADVSGALGTQPALVLPVTPMVAKIPLPRTERGFRVQVIRDRRTGDWSVVSQRVYCDGGGGGAPTEEVSAVERNQPAPPPPSNATQPNEGRTAAADHKEDLVPQELID